MGVTQSVCQYVIGMAKEKMNFDPPHVHHRVQCVLIHTHLMCKLYNLTASAFYKRRFFRFSSHHNMHIII